MNGGNTEQLIVVSVIAGEDKPFDGDALNKAFTNNDLRFGDKGIFHRVIHQAGEYVSVFGVANMVKPGNFEIDAMEEFATRGLTMIMQFLSSYSR